MLACQEGRSLKSIFNHAMAAPIIFTVQQVRCEAAYVACLEMQLQLVQTILRDSTKMQLQQWKIRNSRKLNSCNLFHGQLIKLGVLLLRYNFKSFIICIQDYSLFKSVWTLRSLNKTYSYFESCTKKIITSDGNTWERGQLIRTTNTDEDGLLLVRRREDNPENLE